MKMISPALVGALALAGTLCPAVAQRFVTGQAATTVLGQPDFTSTVATPVLANRFNSPSGVAVDPTTGKVFVSDSLNHRILRFPGGAAAQVGAFPDAVFGQINFSGTAANQGGAASSNTLNLPLGLHVDSLGRLWVADGGNNRVLMFQGASFVGPTNPTADLVLGQPNFAVTTAGVGPGKMNLPYDVSLGPNDVLWVCELNNRRVIRYDDVTTAILGAGANDVLGQPDFGTTTASVEAAKLSAPTGIFADQAGRLWVADATAHRILRFDNAAAKAGGSAADAVIGQTSFTAAASGTSATLLSFPLDVVLDGAGALWVSDSGNRRVVRFPGAAAIDAGGGADLALGQQNLAGNALLPASATTFEEPSSLALGADGRLLVADPDNSRVVGFLPVPRAVFTVIAPKRTARPRVVLRGTVANATAVQVKVQRGAFRPAPIANDRWTFRAKIKPGRNVLTVRALGSGGDAVPRKLLVVRR